MGATSEDLKHDIEAKREELGDHVAALGDQVAPGRVARRRWQGVRSSVLGTADADDPSADSSDSKPRSVPAIAASVFVTGLVLGIWLTRRHYRATLRRARADA
jgi:cobalamin biosynthesis Mg chelatase CobN